MADYTKQEVTTQIVVTSYPLKNLAKLYTLHLSIGIAEWHYKVGLTIEEIQQKLTKPKTSTIAEIKIILQNYKGCLRK